jgi:hypothetical protein
MYLGDKNEFTIANLENCTVWLDTLLSAVRVSNLQGCRVLIGAVIGSFYAIECKDCQFVGATSQVFLCFIQSIFIHLIDRPYNMHSG